MFDVGFSEIMIIAVVALIVLGPERLPKAARFAGLWVRRARAQWYSVKAELERELASEELQRSLKQPLEQLQELQPQMRALDADLRREFAALDPTRAEPTPAMLGPESMAPAAPAQGVDADADADTDTATIAATEADAPASPPADSAATRPAVADAPPPAAA